MAKAPRTQTMTTQTGPDARTQGYQQQVWDAANGAAGAPAAGINPATTQAAGVYGQYANAGQQGAAALGGNQAAIQSFFNPFQQNVLNDIQSNYGTLAKRTLNTVGDQATRAGAFGGSRHGVAEGVALGELGRSAQSQIAQVSQQGFNDSMNRAYMGANLGLAGANGMDDIGRYSTQYADANSPEMRRFGLLSSGFGSMGNTGQTQTQTQPIYNNPWATAGGLLTGGLGLATGLGWAPFAAKAAGAAGGR